jgi:hypothetical protein
MRSRINLWLQREAIPPALRDRVMGDSRLGTRPTGAFRTRMAFATAALVVAVIGGGLGSILLRGNRPSGSVNLVPNSPATSAAPATSPSPAHQSPGVDLPSPVPTVPADAQCRTSDLDIGIGQANGAAGTIMAPINLTNRSTRTCSLQGYFGLALLDASGRQVGPAPTRDPNTFGASPPPGLVVLAPGSSAWFYFHWSDVQNTPQPCPAAAQVELTAPNQYDHALIPARTADGATIAPCSPGTTGLTRVLPKS